MGEPVGVEAGGLVEQGGGLFGVACAVQGAGPLLGGVGGGAVVVLGGVLVDCSPEPVAGLFVLAGGERGEGVRVAGLRVLGVAAGEQVERLGRVGVCAVGVAAGGGCARLFGAQQAELAAGTDAGRATQWRCPTGECSPKSVWIKATRLRPLVPRETRRWRELYRGRAAVEREFGRLKHEYGFTPLRVRGLERVALHGDLVMLARLSQALARARAVPLAA